MILDFCIKYFFISLTNTFHLQSAHQIEDLDGEKVSMEVENISSRVLKRNSVSSQYGNILLYIMIKKVLLYLQPHVVFLHTLNKVVYGLIVDIPRIQVPDVGNVLAFSYKPLNGIQCQNTVEMHAEIIPVKAFYGKALQVR